MSNMELHENDIPYVLESLSKTTPIQAESVSDEEIEKEVLERYPSTCLDWDVGDAFARRIGFRDCAKWLSQLKPTEGEEKKKGKKLQHCDFCNQSTTHIDEICQKCYNV